MRRFLFLAAALQGLWAVPAAAQAITVTPAQPVVGETATVRFETPPDTLFIVTRPGTEIGATTAVPLGRVGSYRWTPEEAGVVQLQAEGVTQNVSVRFAEAPTLGLIMLILAGFILLGGALAAMRALLSGPESAVAETIEHWPDT